MAAATVSATSLGIVVDDTVHMLAKYAEGPPREGPTTAPQAIRYAFQTTGPRHHQHHADPDGSASAVLALFHVPNQRAAGFV